MQQSVGGKGNDCKFINLLAIVILYPYRHSDTDELRYSIRSMVRHFKGLSGVIVIGDCPPWYTGTHIAASDTIGRKEWSIVSKVLLSPAQQFVVCSDDVYAREDLDASLPMYYSEPLRTVKRYGRYAERVANTLAIHPGGLMFDIHTPMVIDYEKFSEAHALCDWSEKEYLCKSVYANHVEGRKVQLPDCKIRKGSTIPDLPFFSTSDQTFHNVPLSKLYPDASPWEKY